MSTNWALRSRGEPYFAMRQKNTAGMDANGLYLYGPSQVSFDVKVNRMPQKVASATEMHGLFSYGWDFMGVGIIQLWEIGLAPDGSICVWVLGKIIKTLGPALLNAATGWTHIDCNYDGGSGDYSIKLNGTVIDSDTATSPAFVVPPAGRTASLMLFNSASGIANGDVSLRNVFLSCNDVDGAHNVYLGGIEHSGFDLAPAPLTAGDFAQADLTLAAAHSPNGSYPYGPISTVNPESGMEWVLATTYTRRVIPKTTYAKAGLST